MIYAYYDGKRIPDCCYPEWWTEEKPTFLSVDGTILGELVNLLSLQLNAQSLIRMRIRIQKIKIRNTQFPN